MKRNTEKKRLFFCKKTIPTLILVEISKFPFLLNIRYSVVNNHRVKRSFCVISSTFLRNHRRRLDMLSEVVFLKDKLYQEILHGELFPFTTEIKDRKTIFSTSRRSSLYSCHYRNVVPRFRNKIISIASIGSSFETDREPVASFNKKSLRSEDYF